MGREQSGYYPLMGGATLGWVIALALVAFPAVIGGVVMLARRATKGVWTTDANYGFRRWGGDGGGGAGCGGGSGDGGGGGGGGHGGHGGCGGGHGGGGCGGSGCGGGH